MESEGTLRNPVDLTRGTGGDIIEWVVQAPRSEWAVYFRGRNIAAGSARHQENAATLLLLAEGGSLWPQYAPATVLLFQRRFRGGYEYLVQRGEKPLRAMGDI